MNTETADRMKNVLAFIVARYKDDEEAALAVIGIKPDPYEPTEEEMKAVYDNVLDLILGVTDFAISQVEMLAMLLKLDTEKLIEKLALTMAGMM